MYPDFSDLSTDERAALAAVVARATENKGEENLYKRRQKILAQLVVPA